MLGSAQQTEPSPERTPEQEADKLTEVMTRTLNLTDKQVPQVYSINLKYAHLRRQPHDRSQAMTNRQRKYEELKTVLTPEQFEVLMMHQQQSRQAVARPQAVIVKP